MERKKRGIASDEVVSQEARKPGPRWPPEVYQQSLLICEFLSRFDPTTAERVRKGSGERVFNAEFMPFAKQNGWCKTGASLTAERSLSATSRG